MTMIVEGSRKKAQQLPHIQSTARQIPDDSETGFWSEHNTESQILEDSSCDAAEQKKTFNGVAKKVTALTRQQNSTLNNTNSLMFQVEVLTELLTAPNGTPVPALTQRLLLVLMALGVMFRSDTIGIIHLLEAHAMLLHVIALEECRLPDRAVGSIYHPRSMKFLKDFSGTAL